MTDLPNQNDESGRKKVVLIGPSAERYKGGIAQFTSHLADVLGSNHDLSYFSWYKLYPYFLSRRDFVDRVSDHRVGKSAAQFTLGYMNPLSWFRTLRKISQKRPDIVLLTWIHPVHAPIYFVFYCYCRLFTRASIVYLCHNVLPHERFRGAKLLAKCVLRRADRIVVHGRSEAEQAKQLAPKIPVTTLFLPLHDFFDTSNDEGSKQQGKRLLFFGVIRPYKGLDLLLRALPEVRRAHPDVSLTIAGEFFDPTVSTAGSPEENPLQLIRELNLADVVRAEIRYIPNEEVASFFRGADVVVLPYRSASQSGGLTIAYSYGVPVIVTKVGGLPDVVEDGVSGLLVEPNDSTALARAIISFLDLPLPTCGVRKFARGLSWDVYASRLMEAGESQSKDRSSVSRCETSEITRCS